MCEIDDGVLSYVKEEFDEAIKGSNARVQRNS